MTEREKTKWRSGLAWRRGVSMKEEEQEVKGRSWQCLQHSVQLQWRSHWPWGGGGRNKKPI